MPKKAEIQVVKCEGKINVVMVDDEPLFYNGVVPRQETPIAQSFLPHVHALALVARMLSRHRNILQ